MIEMPPLGAAFFMSEACFLDVSAISCLNQADDLIIVATRTGMSPKSGENE